MIRMLFFLFAVLLAACTTTKKAVSTETVKVAERVTASTTQSVSEKLQDTATISEGRIVVTEVEFFRTYSTSPAFESIAVSDGAFRLGGIKGSPIKAIRQTSYEQKHESKGSHKEKQVNASHSQAVELRREAVKSAKHATRIVTPFWQKHGLYAAILVLVWLLYLKRMPIIEWLRRWLGIRNYNK